MSGFNSGLLRPMAWGENQQRDAKPQASLGCAHRMPLRFRTDRVPQSCKRSRGSLNRGEDAVSEELVDRGRRVFHT
jgi:hypothetical protein